MHWSRFAGLLLLSTLATTAAFAAKPRPCFTADEAAKMLQRDVCISAHIYEVVELDDGTRYLDVCSPQFPDDECKFTIVSLPEDRKTVGELSRFRNQNVQIRGTVKSMSGRAGILLSHARQFSGGPPKFTPNPLLVRGFNSEQAQPPVSDPNLRGLVGRRTFMSPRNQAAPSH